MCIFFFCINSYFAITCYLFVSWIFTYCCCSIYNCTFKNIVFSYCISSCELFCLSNCKSVNCKCIVSSISCQLVCNFDVVDCYISVISYCACKELLTTSDLSVTQIASSAGFSSQSYFSQIFNKKVGMSPRQYRKLYSHEKKE